MKYFTEIYEEFTKGLLESCGAFYAFSQSQFDEKKKEGKKYVSMGHGLICEKEHAERLYQGLDKAFDEAIKADYEANGFDKIVEREYFNYETQISMDNTDFLESLNKYKDIYPEVFTDEAIQKASNRCFQKAVDNDWF